MMRVTIGEGYLFSERKPYLLAQWRAHPMKNALGVSNSIELNFKEWRKFLIAIGLFGRFGGWAPCIDCGGESQCEEIESQWQVDINNAFIECRNKGLEAEHLARLEWLNLWVTFSMKTFSTPAIFYEQMFG